MSNQQNSKQKFAKLFIIVGLCLSLAAFAPGVAQAAESATFIMEPGSGSYTVGDNFTVTLSEDSGATEVNAVEADMTYDKSMLSVVSLDDAGSGFGVDADKTAGGGVITVARGSKPDSQGKFRTNKQKIISITFNVLSAGTTQIKYSTSSQVIKSAGSTDILTKTSVAATFSLANKPVTPVQPAPSAGGGTTTTPKTGSAPTSTTTKPSTTTTKPSTSGSTGQNTSTTPRAASVQTVENPDVNQPVISDQSFVAIKVVDDDGKAIVGATVKLDSGETATTDSSGVASFLSVAKGDHKLAVTYSGKTINQSITVKAPAVGDSSKLQSFDVKLAGSKAATHSSWGIYAGLTAVAVVILWIVIMPRRHKLVVNEDIAVPAGIFVGDQKGTSGDPVHAPTNLSASTTPQPPVTHVAVNTPNSNQMESKIIYPTGQDPNETKPDDEPKV